MSLHSEKSLLLICLLVGCYDILKKLKPSLTSTIAKYSAEVLGSDRLATIISLNYNNQSTSVNHCFIYRCTAIMHICLRFHHQFVLEILTCKTFKSWYALCQGLRERSNSQEPSLNFSAVRWSWRSVCIPKSHDLLSMEMGGMSEGHDGISAEHKWGKLKTNSCGVLAWACPHFL